MLHFLGVCVCVISMKLSKDYGYEHEGGVRGNDGNVSVWCMQGDCSCIVIINLLCLVLSGSKNTKAW